jgi:hypothetical protein
MASDDMILFNNGLTYQLPVPSSVAVNKTKKRSYFQNRSYKSGETMVATLNTGSSFIDLTNSNLVVKVKVSSTNAGNFSCGFGAGSAMNVVENARIYHRSGTQYTNTQKVNMFRVQEDLVCESANWFDTIGANMGYQQGDNVFNNLTPQRDFVIPLKKLHPFFDPCGGDDIMGPPQMYASLRVELDQATIGQIFTNGAANVADITDFEIVDIYFDLECVDLMDSAQASINTNAQKKALEYLYRDVFTSRTASPNATSVVNVDINKSVSYASRVVATINNNNRQNTLALDAFTIPYKNGSWWYQLGSNQYPSNQKIDAKPVAYQQVLTAYNKLTGKCGERGETYLAPLTHTFINGLYAASLELNTALELSGMPVTSSRTLRFELTLDTPATTDFTTIIFMTYLASARSTLTSSRVDI